MEQHIVNKIVNRFSHEFNVKTSKGSVDDCDYGRGDTIGIFVQKDVFNTPLNQTFTAGVQVSVISYDGGQTCIRISGEDYELHAPIIPAVVWKKIIRAVGRDIKESRTSPFMY